jgi:parvulin-like peptidyl-prolyl isomerase
MTQNIAQNAAGAGRQTKSRGKRAKVLLGSLFVMALCGVVRYYWTAPSANADAPRRNEAGANRSSDATRQAASANQPARPEANATPSIPEVVATVNTTRITKEELGRECLRHFGEEVLESMVNKRLITLACREKGVTVSREEVNEEVERMAKRFKIPVDQWMKMLKRERNVTPEQYTNDIIWPTIALRKLAGDQLTVTQKEVFAEFETQYGMQIRARLIAVKSLEKAKDLHAEAVKNPRNFGNLAKEFSEDAPSAAVKGIINPIRKHGSYEAIENAVFKMNDGEISPVIKAGGQYVIIKREQAIPAQPVDFEQVAGKLEEFLRDRKMRAVAQTVFKELQDAAMEQKAVQNVWNDRAKRKQFPGVAALVYDDQITIRELAEQCIARHGQEVLEGVINRKIVELECKKRSIVITEDEIDREIARAAMAGVKAKQDGSPDIKAWLDLVVKRGVSIDVYRNDAIWTTVALKKLVGDKVQITEDDLKKGYEANFGERVRCLAIVLNDLRRAQQVFEMARKDNTSETFSKLASEYSVEPGSQALGGEVPPIKRHGGQPILEEEAFQLKAGELSGVIQVGDKFVILRCEGHTKPIGVDFASVRGEIERDLHDKKLRLAMEERFEDLQEAAQIDNYLANTSHSPRSSKNTAQLPSIKQIPAR